MHGTRSRSTTENSNPSDKLEIVKNKILSEFQNFRDEYVKDITELKSSLEELKAQNITLKKKVKSLQHDVDEKENIIIELEKAVAEHQQYTRRNNVEIAGIPDSTTQELLEDKVIQLAGSIDIKLQSSDIEACHRLKKSKNPNMPQVTIVRFINRKHAELLHRNKKKLTKKSLTNIGLGKHKIYIINNLCPYYKVIMGKASQLYKEKKIFKY